MKRPKHLDPPAYLSLPVHVDVVEDVAEPKPIDESSPPEGEEARLDPTRYGDWEKKGIAIDF